MVLLKIAVKDNKLIKVRDRLMIEDGKTWVSTVDNNVWAPDVHGWEEI